MAFAAIQAVRLTVERHVRDAGRLLGEGANDHVAPAIGNCLLERMGGAEFQIDEDVFRVLHETPDDVLQAEG